jgi:hypothetical protein
MTKKTDASDKDIEQIMEDAQVLLNFCGNTFVKPADAWFACLVSSAILTAELSVPLEKFFEGFEHAYSDAMKAKNEMKGASYDH